MNQLSAYECWQPYDLAEVARLCVGLDWILAGGQALAFFLGRKYRLHSDIDLLIRRDDQEKITQILEPQKLFIATQPGILTPLDSQKYYESPIQDIWGLNADSTAWGLQMMLFDVVNDAWVYKRHPAIKLPLSQIYFEKEGIKAVKPEIQLLYKSKTIRPRDQLDFETIVSALDDEARQWLLNALDTCYGQTHIWSGYLKKLVK